MPPAPRADEVVRTIFDAFARRDLETLRACCEPDVEFWPEGTGRRRGRDRDQPYRGYAGLEEYLRDVGQIWERLEVLPRDVRVAGAGVIAFGHARGRARTGEDVEVPVIWVLKLRGDRLRFGRAVQTAAQAEVVAAAPDGGAAGRS